MESNIRLMAQTRIEGKVKVNPLPPNRRFDSYLCVDTRRQDEPSSFWLQGEKVRIRHNRVKPEMSLISAALKHFYTMNLKEFYKKCQPFVGFRFTSYISIGRQYGLKAIREGGNKKSQKERVQLALVSLVNMQYPTKNDFQYFFWCIA